MTDTFCVQGESGAKRALLDSVAGHLGSVLCAGRAPLQRAGLPAPLEGDASWRDQLALAPPLRTLFSQLSAANEVFSLGVRAARPACKRLRCTRLCALHTCCPSWHCTFQ
jgi:hypothetical protein